MQRGLNCKNFNFRFVQIYSLHYSKKPNKLFSKIFCQSQVMVKNLQASGDVLTVQFHTATLNPTACYSRSIRSVEFARNMVKMIFTMKNWTQAVTWKESENRIHLPKCMHANTQTSQSYMCTSLHDGGHSLP